MFNLSQFVKKTFGASKAMGYKTNTAKQTTKKTMGYKKSTTPTKLSGHDPARKKTGATATALGSTYDFRKNLSTKSATKKKSASVTVGTAGSSKSTKVDLNKKHVVSKPKTVDGKTIKHAPPGGWGSKTTSTTTKPKAPAKKTMTVKTSAGDSGSGPTKQAAMNDMRRKSGRKRSGGMLGRLGARRGGSPGTERHAHDRPAAGERIQHTRATHTPSVTKSATSGRRAGGAGGRRKGRAKGPNANASDMAKKKTAAAHAKHTDSTSTVTKPKGGIFANKLKVVAKKTKSAGSIGSAIFNKFRSRFGKRS